MDSVAIFVDVQNIYYTVRESYGCHFNYQAFWDHVTHDREVVCAYAIDRQDPRQMQFQKILESIGFEVKLKPYIQRKDEAGLSQLKANSTTELFRWRDVFALQNSQSTERDVSAKT